MSVYIILTRCFQSSLCKRALLYLAGITVKYNCHTTLSKDPYKTLWVGVSILPKAYKTLERLFIEKPIRWGVFILPNLPRTALGL